MSLIVIAQNITDGGKTLSRSDGTADYDVEVSVNRERFIWTGKVEGHVRDGAAALLRKIADKMGKL